MSEQISELTSIIKKITLGLQERSNQFKSLQTSVDNGISDLNDDLVKISEYTDKLRPKAIELQNQLQEKLSSELSVKLNSSAESLESVNDIIDDFINEDADPQSLLDVSSSLRQMHTEGVMHIETAGALMISALENEADYIDSLDDQLNSFSSNFRDEVNTLVSDLGEALESVVISPFEESAKNIQNIWQEAVIEKIDEQIEEQLEQIKAHIESHVAEALEILEDIIRTQFESLRNSLLEGDSGGRESKAELDEAMDTIKEALTPVKAALDAFTQLASTAGISIG